MFMTNAEFAVWTPEKGDTIHVSLARDTLVNPATVVGYIGNPMVLHEKYHPDQGWLPFMQGAILRYAPGDYYDADQPQRAINPHHVRNLMKREARVPPECERMYVYDNFDQYQIPFVEFRYAGGGSESHHAMKMWQRRIGADGKLASVPSTMTRSMLEKDFIAWAAEAFVGRFTFHIGRIVFENPADAVLVTLKFREPKT